MGWWQKKLDERLRRVVLGRTPPLGIGRKRPLHREEIATIVVSIFRTYNQGGRDVSLSTAIASKEGIQDDDAALQFSLDLQAEFGIILTPVSRWNSVRTLADVVEEFDRVINPREFRNSGDTALN